MVVTRSTSTDVLGGLGGLGRNDSEDFMRKLVNIAEAGGQGTDLLQLLGGEGASSGEKHLARELSNKLGADLNSDNNLKKLLQSRSDTADLLEQCFGVTLDKSPTAYIAGPQTADTLDGVKQQQHGQPPADNPGSSAFMDAALQSAEKQLMQSREQIIASPTAQQAPSLVAAAPAAAATAAAITGAAFASRPQEELEEMLRKLRGASPVVGNQRGPLTRARSTEIQDPKRRKLVHGDSTLSVHQVPNMEVKAAAAAMSPKVEAEVKLMVKTGTGPVPDGSGLVRTESNTASSCARQRREERQKHRMAKGMMSQTSTDKAEGGKDKEVEALKQQLANIEKENRSLNMRLAFMNRLNSEQTLRIEELEASNKKLEEQLREKS